MGGEGSTELPLGRRSNHPDLETHVGHFAIRRRKLGIYAVGRHARVQVPRGWEEVCCASALDGLRRSGEQADRREPRFRHPKQDREPETTAPSLHRRLLQGTSTPHILG